MKKVILVLVFLFWPLSLLLHNTLVVFLATFVLALFVCLSFLLYRAGFRLYVLPLVFLPFFEPKLSLLPALAATWEVLRERGNRAAFVVLGLALLAIVVNFSQFRGQTIFTQDYEAEQRVLEKINLYPTVLLARVFQNKARIYLDKISFNFFALTDPNNYFFGFHPREIVLENQNLKKFPSAGIIFLLLGLYNLGRYRYKDFIVPLIFCSLISLVILKIFDRADFILWIPLGLLVVHGTDMMKNKFLRMPLFGIFIVLTLVQLLRLFFE